MNIQLAPFNKIGQHHANMQNFVSKTLRQNKNTEMIVDESIRNQWTATLMIAMAQKITWMKSTFHFTSKNHSINSKYSVNSQQDNYANVKIINGNDATHNLQNVFLFSKWLWLFLSQWSSYSDWTAIMMHYNNGYKKKEGMVMHNELMKNETCRQFNSSYNL